MKLLFAILLIALCGCGPSYNPTVIRANVGTQFGTTEVYHLGNECFIVRDTNGAVWYVDAVGTTNYSAKIFRETDK